MASELVEFDDEYKTLGITLNLEEDNVGVVILGNYTQIKEGMTVKSYPLSFIILIRLGDCDASIIMFAPVKSRSEKTGCSY